MCRRRWPQVQWLTRTLPSAGIIKRYCEGFFTPNYKLTIGVDFAVKVVEWDDRTRVSLQVRAAQLSLSDRATAAALELTKRHSCGMWQDTSASVSVSVGEQRETGRRPPHSQ